VKNIVWCASKKISNVKRPYFIQVFVFHTLVSLQADNILPTVESSDKVLVRIVNHA